MLPDWVAAVAVRADEASLRAVAKGLKVSHSALSGILSNSYPADTFDMEQRVRAAFPVTPAVVMQAGWGDAMPDWVKALADACAATSQQEAARRIEYTASVVNQVLKNTYKGNMRRVEYQVRGLLMKQTVACPFDFEPLPQESCVWMQEISFDKKRALPNAAAYRAKCPLCPNFLKKK
jgi:hypothetical protein